MIRATARSRLTSTDLDLAVLLLSRGSVGTRRRLERALLEEGPDALLDAPLLLERLVAVRTILVPSDTLFFYVLVRHALRAGGIDDREVADYLTTLLLDFGRRDRALRVDWHDDQRHGYVVDIVADLASSHEPRRFQVMVHLGNYALWLAGLFPGRILAKRERCGGPGLGYYDAMGRRGYGMASDHALAATLGLAQVFRTAAERFPALRAALNDVSARVGLSRAGLRAPT